MERACTSLSQAVRRVQLLKMDGFCAASATSNSNSGSLKSRWNVDGHVWEVGLCPSLSDGRRDKWVSLFLRLVNDAEKDVRASLSCRLVDPSCNLQPSGERNVCHLFSRFGGYSVTHTVECTITVLKEIPDVTIPDTMEEAPLPMPSSDLHQHLGDLLQSQTGADIKFLVSGESFSAHKNILAARSPVFMAEFFGHMSERSSKCVQILDMDAAIFKAMLHFIYTDTAPELDGPPEAVATMAQHLLTAADRYGLDRLKLICERKLSGGIGVDTAATTLALAEQHNCSELRAKCVEFITASPEMLDAVVATEGYRHLVASCPLVLTELLKAAHGRRN
ncbi:hypothetical protein ACP4OV_014091 [Aristida adscensionis]